MYAVSQIRKQYFAIATKSKKGTEISTKFYL